MRFIAYWRRGAGHVNIPIDSYDVADSIIFIYSAGRQVGLFDMGFLDAWYVSEQDGPGGARL